MGRVLEGLEINFFRGGDGWSGFLLGEMIEAHRSFCALFLEVLEWNFAFGDDFKVD